MSVDQNSSSQKSTPRNAEAMAIEFQDNVLKINDRILSGADERTYVKETCIKQQRFGCRNISDNINFFWYISGRLCTHAYGLNLKT